MQVPIGLEENFQGLIDLVHVKAYFFHGSSGFVLYTFFRIVKVAVGAHVYVVTFLLSINCSENVVAGDIPADMEELVAEKRRELIETVSEVDDILAEKFLNDEPVSATELEVLFFVLWCLLFNSLAVCANTYNLHDIKSKFFA